MSADLGLPSFEVGRTYQRRDDIHARFGGSRQSGISPSASHPAIFIFTGESGAQYGYADGFDAEDVFSYSGEGQTGDMTFKAGNKALRDHAVSGRAVHLFEALGKSKPCKYMGEFAVANHSIRRGPDRERNERDIITFHLMRVGYLKPIESSALPLLPTSTTTLREARSKALMACSAPPGGAGIAAVRTMHSRSEDVRRYVLMRDGGSCRGCGLPAPFLNRSGEPYLEPHHTIRLSDGGLDHPRHVIALCPKLSYMRASWKGWSSLER